MKGKPLSLDATIPPDENGYYVDQHSGRLVGIGIHDTNQCFGPGILELAEFCLEACGKAFIRDSLLESEPCDIIT